MHVATYYGNVTLVLILLQHGGSPDFTNVVSTLFIVFQNYCSHFLCPVISANGLVGTCMYIYNRGEMSNYALLSPRTLFTGLILTYPSIK